MRIRIICVGTRPPQWVREGYEQYARRMPRECRLELREVAAEKRRGSEPPGPARQREGERLLGAAGKGDLVIALDGHGAAWDTAGLSRRLGRWLQEGRNISMLIGGADGLPCVCVERSAMQWSLSALTFPHALVRVIVAEQLYRACSMLRNHPYHRA